MADLERPLAALVDPPLAPPPPLADIEHRAGRHRLRRRIGTGAGAAVAVVALVAGLVTALPRSDRAVHTAATGGGGGDAASLAQGPPTTPGAAADVALDTFEAGGQRWRLAFAGQVPGICVEVRSDTAVAGGLCREGTALQALAIDVSGTTYLFGFAPGATTGVSFGTDGVVPIRGGSLAGALNAGGNPDQGVDVFGRTLPPELESVELVAATATDPRAYTLAVPLPIHRRISVVNGQDTPAIPTSTVVRTTVPRAAPVTTVAPTPTTTAPPASSPPTTAPPSTGGPKQVTVTPGASNLTRIRFESAMASGSQSLAVRFWAGVEPCTVLGKVDVVESADKVTVTLWTGTTNSLMICTAMAQYFETIVPLSAPLGTRAVVDGAA